jgi:hypothetical protein
MNLKRYLHISIPHTTQKDSFYNILLQNASVQNENELLSTSNFEKHYVHECYIRQFLPSLDNLQTNPVNYTHLNWTLKKKRLLEEILKDHPYLDLEYTQPKRTINFVFHNKEPLCQKCHFMIFPIQLQVDN